MKTRSLPITLALLALVFLTNTLRADDIPVFDLPPVLVSLTDPAPYLKTIPATALPVKSLSHTFKQYKGDTIEVMNDTGRPFAIVVNGKPYPNMVNPGKMFVVDAKMRIPFGFALFRRYGEVIVMGLVSLDKNNQPTSAAVRVFRFCDFVRGGNFYNVPLFVKTADLVPLSKLSEADVVVLKPKDGSPPLAERVAAAKR